MKYTIMQESRFDFLRELVKNIPDMGVSDDGCNDDSNESPEESTIPTPNISLYSDNPQDQPINLSCNKASTSRSSHLNGSAPHTPTTSSSNARLPSTSAVQQQQQYSPYSSTSPTSSRNSGQRNIHHNQSIASDNNENIDKMRLKRQWQNVRTMRGQIVENDSAKLLRTNSTPTDLQMPTTPNQRSRGRTRNVGLTHQPRSVPTTPLTPIVRVDFDNEPIIKIDFTNTNLHDNSQSGSSVSVSAASRRTDQSGPSTAGEGLGPVVNIDLSNFTALTNNHTKIPTVTIPAVTAAPSTSSILELDEDYDNI
ncbi:DRAP1 family protein [Megaselia abdita]